MKLILRYMLYALVKMAGRKRIRLLIPTIANYSELDLLLVAYNNIGILNFENETISGEQFLLTRVLKENLVSISRPVIFDVGASVGKYSMMMAKEFPDAQIYAFEPNCNTFGQLIANVGNLAKCFNAGMGNDEKTEKIFSYSDNLASSHASMFVDVFHMFHNTKDVTEIDFQMITLDKFCEREKITDIDFLKIDTEGNELNVLMGAKRMLSDGRIKIIQFEFGECDVYSRVFLRDFYELLADYNIYRLDSQRLIPLFEYASTNEIFRFQNFIAVRKDFTVRTA
jgi:FkbM family methyltransferase